MPLPFRPPREFLRTAETLLIATAGGVAFTLIGFPAGLIAGSMLAVAVAALIGRPMQVPLPLARVCFVLVGILLGASPGSMAQVLALSAELGADLRGVAIVQTTRVLLIVLGLPAGLALFGLTVGPLA